MCFGVLSSNFLHCSIYWFRLVAPFNCWYVAPQCYFSRFRPGVQAHSIASVMFTSNGGFCIFAHYVLHNTYAI